MNYHGQLNLFGEIVAPPLDSYRDRVAWILENYPEARNDDRLCLYLYWLLYDGLGVALGSDETIARFRHFIENNATTPETIRRRRAEIQKLRYPGAGTLLPNSTEQARRRALDGAGSPDRWRK